MKIKCTAHTRLQSSIVKKINNKRLADECLPIEKLKS